ncbi:M16 family metallopeptidase [Chungangia koreensis]|uniref:M16 family metallopeptidase n=1 Tax=Chungangia koreensis TaxID=752657 RepID=A0ABV8X1G0_9LACT
MAVETLVCENGVRIVHEFVPHVRSVSVGIWVKAGSRHELPHENGLTHFIEHMLFKGTASRTAKQIAEEFDRIGGNINAFTSKEYTCYYSKTLDHHAGKAIDILKDMFFNSLFSEEEIEKERQVVLEEILMVEDTPDDDVHEQLWHVMYPDHPMGASILGTPDTLKSFSADTIRTYMEKQYVPENIIISIAGNIDKDLIDLIENNFGNFQRNRRSEHVTSSPTFVAGHSLKERETEQGHLCFGFEGLPVKDPDIYSLVVINNILGGSMSSRLFQEVREEKGLAYSIYSYHSSYSDHGSVVIYGGTSSNQMEELQQTILESIRKIKSEGMTDTEIDNAKEQLKGNLLLGLEGTSARMNRNGKNEIVYGEHKTTDEILQQIDKVDGQSVKAVIDRLLDQKPAISIIAPK